MLGFFQAGSNEVIPLPMVNKILTKRIIVNRMFGAHMWCQVITGG